ncbi:hypothetical protein SPRG_01641 [Saprolegnia parasitica CBS 223.65]|uniref:EF-hand domain-containing protein n=1 Tax=Saprolegnia parasitica (strain CBS 223.65) TaxID=695850 RepID=A0A067CWZ2_SAPPC|nr:hypothetical protein SPRG_01641 [Saprolegnia parasitica CBS 223.65]KDO33760.1 hypothetical protein SPRG_01641 [Saprolegnia parasitica CBS 223.65]|eukprot:XP_012195398.1 hypothetical protein SPRG_01641 [Saprolegnia parasitica CBS 223.65]
MSGLGGVVGASCVTRRPPHDPRSGSTVLDVLTRKLRLKLEALIPIENERVEKAFELFTTTESISPNAFHLLLLKFRICANRQQSYALFHLYDTDATGRLDRAKFKRGVFGRCPGTPRGKRQHATTTTAATTTTLLPKKKAAAMSALATAANGQSTLAPPVVVAQPSDRVAHKPMRLHHPARAQHEVTVGDNLPFPEIVKRIREKIDQRTSKASDRFRQAFMIFAKASGITLDEFHEGLLRMGFRLTSAQTHELFAMFDADHSGDLDLNEFVQGISIDDYSATYIQAQIERQKREDVRRVRYAAAVHSVEASWSIEDMERKLREKIEQHTSRSSDCFRQALQIFKKTSGIRAHEFHDALAELGLDLPRDGDIDLNEFVRGVLPPDYTKGTWVAEADEMARQEALRKQLQPDAYYNRVNIDHWSLETIQTRLRERITQKTSKSSDTFRQVYRVFQKSHGITFDEFKRGVLVLGFRLNETQARSLFDRYDTDRSSTIDLAEFCKHVLAPDYTGDGDVWGMTHDERMQKRADAIAYAALTKNGTVRLATPPRPTSAPSARPATPSSSNASGRRPSSPRKHIRPSKPGEALRRATIGTPTRPSSAVGTRPLSARPSTALDDRPARPVSAGSRLPLQKAKRESHMLWRRKIMAHQANAAGTDGDDNDDNDDDNDGVDDDETPSEPDDERDATDTSSERPASATRSRSIASPTSTRPSSPSSQRPSTPSSRRLSSPSSRRPSSPSSTASRPTSPRPSRRPSTPESTSSISRSSQRSGRSEASLRPPSTSRELPLAKFSPRTYSHGFKRLFLQMAKDKLLP